LLAVTSPRISIALASYNGAEFIGEQLASFAAQTRLPFELQVGDDGSSDATLEIVEEFVRSAPFPVHAVRNSENLGFADNFLSTSERCSGDWIAFADQDDVWLPNKLERIAQAIEAHAKDELALVAHKVEVTDAELRPTGGRPGWLDWSGTNLKPWLGRRGLWSVGGCVIVFRAELVREIDWRDRPFNENAWRNLGCPKQRMDPHDRWVCLLANALGATLLLDEKLGLFRRHEAAGTGRHVNPGVRESIAEAAGTGADSYRRDEKAALDADECLRRHAANAAEPTKSRLEEAARAFERLAAVQGGRARLYERGGRIGRLGELAALVRGRAYFGDSFVGLGARSLLKDSVAALAPSLLR
jgi:hypothetical protein